MTERKLLEGIESPEDLRRLSRERVQQLAEEVRAEIIERVSKTGGHLASSLGAVELITGIHYVFDTPRDRLVLDVGHQGYPHKILTGRRTEFDRLGKEGGIGKFLRRQESAYDPFGAGHAGTSISAALGMAQGLQHQGVDHLRHRLDRRRRHDRGNGLRGLEPRRRPRAEEPGGGAERQRDVDLSQCGRHVLVSVSKAVGAHGAAHEGLGEGVSLDDSRRHAPLGAEGRGIPQGLLLSGTALRGAELQVRGPDPGPPDGCGAGDFREREGHARQRRRPHPGSRAHRQGLRLRAGPERSLQVSTGSAASTWSPGGSTRRSPVHPSTRGSSRRR